MSTNETYWKAIIIKNCMVLDYKQINGKLE